MEPEKLLRVRNVIETMIAVCEDPGAEDDRTKIDLKKIICFAIPIYNLIGSMFGLPPLPLPAFCTT
jgi:hypothetical protein